MDCLLDEYFIPTSICPYLGNASQVAATKAGILPSKAVARSLPLDQGAFTTNEPHLGTFSRSSFPLSLLLVSKFLSGQLYRLKRADGTPVVMALEIQSHRHIPLPSVTFQMLERLNMTCLTSIR